MSDRRRSADRRSRWGRERRRKGEQRVFVLELSSTDLGVVELQKSTSAGQPDELRWQVLGGAAHPSGDKSPRHRYIRPPRVIFGQEPLADID